MTYSDLQVIRPKHLEAKVCGISWETLFARSCPYGDDVFDSAIDELHRLQEQGIIAISSVNLLPTHDAPIDIKQFSGRSNRHRQLCASSAVWLRSIGKVWTTGSKELRYAGGRADVAASDGTIFVECGYTQSRKIMDGLRQRRTMVVVPYQENVTAYVFVPVGKIPKDLKEIDLQKKLIETMKKRHWSLDE